MNDKERLQIVKMRAAGKGYGTIARKLGIPLSTVASFCRRRRINKDTAASSPLIMSGVVTNCENCGARILQVATQKPRRICSDRCRNQWWANHLDLVKRKAYYTIRCRHCGKVFQVYGDRNRKYCSRACYLAD